MTNREFAAGVCRAWGLMWLVSALIAVPQIVGAVVVKPFAGSDPGIARYATSSQILVFLTEIAAGVFLLEAARWLAQRIFPHEDGLSLSISAADLQAVLFSVIGLYFAIGGFRGLLGSLYFVLLKPAAFTQSNYEYLWSQRWQKVAESVTELIVGVLLFFGAGGLRGLWRRYRDIGSTTAPPEPSLPGATGDKE